jgi:AAHS family 4-hydroxybenzoate transporter-like MFS transporter
MPAMLRRVLALCFCVVLVDGFDTAVVGFIAPAVRVEWRVDVSRLGPLFAAGLVGLMVGAFAVGPLADRYGRKALLVASMLFFGVASLAASFSTGLRMLTALRFLTGVGLGGAMPTSITLSSECSPAERRASLVTLMFCGFTIGSALAGLAAAQVLDRAGWRPLLAAGGLVPLALAPVLWSALPESSAFAGTRSSRTEPSPVVQLLSGGLMVGTLALWLAFFMSLLVVYLLSNWMPTLIQRSTGGSLGHAALIAAMLQVGGTAGAIVVGRLMDEMDPHYVLGGVYLAGAAFIVMISRTTATPWLMGAAVFGAGFCISGGQVGGNALSAEFYPAEYRATGVAWANGIGRSGSIVGSLVGGGMLALGWTVTTVYALVAIPAAISAIALVALGSVRRDRPNARV